MNTNTIRLALHHYFTRPFADNVSVDAPDFWREFLRSLIVSFSCILGIALLGVTLIGLCLASFHYLGGAASLGILAFLLACRFFPSQTVTILSYTLAAAIVIALCIAVIYAAAIIFAVAAGGILLFLLGAALLGAFIGSKIF